MSRFSPAASLRDYIIPLHIDPLALTVILGTGDALSLGCPTLEILGPDVLVELTKCARCKIGPTKTLMKTVYFIACRCVSLSVETIQQQLMVEQVRKMTPKRPVSIAACNQSTASARRIEESGVGAPMQCVSKGIAG